ncbi:TetR family transcriptional regulator [Pseudomonas sp. ICMP 8385]|uniref:TetR family transcriptional regulator n=2 Tax=Pseudomonas TaxID=286 RepID=A0A7Y1MLE4_9PSED|nr:TetR/AcrR family transcriptional regulator [Pseudomonas gessardii]PHN52559.1 TetR family transcriptional regulator [Pseudomonas sp. ICMP 8385]MCF4979621.1 TetR family transcriptional regulator [Pseudomonas gessardii]MCF4993479.1 TetR family transcriptional regulator [Pseudomonas gessardii]MCF5084507.1 TetR family transcriptional regulator [Pseudomonas gessardii]
MAIRGRPRTFDREKALALAMEVFWEYGYDGASLTLLTGAMGISTPSLYSAFGNKEVLFREALAHYLFLHGPDHQGSLGNAATAREGIAGLLRETVDMLCTHQQSRGCLIVLAALSGNPESKAVRDALCQQRKESVRLFRQRLEQGAIDGELPVERIEELAVFYSTVLFGLSIQARDQVPREQLYSVVDTAMRAWPQE